MLGLEGTKEVNEDGKNRPNKTSWDVGWSIIAKYDDRNTVSTDYPLASDPIKLQNIYFAHRIWLVYFKEKSFPTFNNQNFL